MKSFYIGSGDVGALMAGLQTKTHQTLLRRFVSDEIPHYNAKASPIDALRTGAILEDNYALFVPDGYYPQVKVISEEMNVLKASLDFAKIENKKVVDFQELKTCSFTDFLKFEEYRTNLDLGIEKLIKKKYKKNYVQVQQQLFCSGLDSATLVFLAVYTYKDEENINRVIKPNELIKFRIKRDEKVIAAIKERAKIFQQIKDIYDVG